MCSPQLGMQMAILRQRTPSASRCRIPCLGSMLNAHTLCRLFSLCRCSISFSPSRRRVCQRVAAVSERACYSLHARLHQLSRSAWPERLSAAGRGLLSVTQPQT
jgi:hypothetical protein